MMQAVILAGGLGTRLQPLTQQVPKPLLPVRGQPFLHHQIDSIRSFGFTRALLLVSYLGEQIEQYFGDGSRFGLRIDYAWENTPLGTGGALKNAEKQLEQDFLLLNGDSIVFIDYQQLVACYRRRQRWGLVVAFENSSRAIANNLAIGPAGRVTAYSRHNASGLTHVHAGAAILSRRILELIPAGRACSLEDETYPELIEKGELCAFRTQRMFYDMGSFDGLLAMEEMVACNGAAHERPAGPAKLLTTGMQRHSGLTRGGKVRGDTA